MAYSKAAAARRPPREYLGHPLDLSLLIDPIDVDGAVWLVFKRGQTPNFIDLKVVADGRAPRKANYWILWNGSRIVNRADGRDMREKHPALYEAVTDLMKQVPMGAVQTAKRVQQVPMGAVATRKNGGLASRATVQQVPIYEVGDLLHVARDAENDSKVDVSDLI